MAEKRPATIRAVYGRTEDRYLELVREFPQRPLRTDKESHAAIATIDSLLDRPKLMAAERAYLDVLSDLVAAYEAKAVPIPPVGDEGMLRFLIEQNELT